MKKNQTKSLALLVALSCLLPSTVLAGENAITLSAGGAIGGGGSSTSLLFEYERALTSKIALAGRGGYLSYKYSDDEYEEDGNGPGAQMSVKFYPGAQVFHGFYFGGGLGLWQMNGDWTDDKGTYWESTGTVDTLSSEIHGEVGWRVGESIQFSPSIQVGTFLSSDAVLSQFFNVNVGVSFIF
jgi:hypothetical protein